MCKCNVNEHYTTATTCITIFDKVVYIFTRLYINFFFFLSFILLSFLPRLPLIKARHCTRNYRETASVCAQWNLKHACLFVVCVVVFFSLLLFLMKQKENSKKKIGKRRGCIKYCTGISRWKPLFRTFSIIIPFNWKWN